MKTGEYAGVGDFELTSLEIMSGDSAVTSDILCDILMSSFLIVGDILSIERSDGFTLLFLDEVS